MPSRPSLGLLLGLGLLASAARADVLVDFEDLTFAAPHPPLDTLPPGSTGSFDNGYDLGGGFSSRGAFFNNDYHTSTFGGVTTDYWGGWSYSNAHDTTPLAGSLPVSNPTPVPTDYLHQYASITGGGVGGSGNYGVADAGDFAGDTKAAYINLPTGTFARSFSVTNTVYTYLSAVYGDGFAAPLKPGDFLTLKVVGFTGLGASGSSVGEVDVSLADYTKVNANQVPIETILTTWLSVDLSSLASARSLGFEVAGNLATQYSTFGGTAYLNQPSYFAMDKLILGAAAVPEPSSFALAGLGLAVLGWGQVRRKTA